MDTSSYNFGFFNKETSTSTSTSTSTPTFTFTSPSPSPSVQSNPFQIFTTPSSTYQFERTIPVFDYNSSSNVDNKSKLGLGLKDSHKSPSSTKKSPPKLNDTIKSFETLSLSSTPSLLSNLSEYNSINQNNNISSSSSLSLVGPFDKNRYGIREWIMDGSIAFYIGEEINRPNIAAFDMDDTLIRTKSGRTFAIDQNDWVWWNQCVPENLRKLYEQGYQVVIITNQASIGYASKFNQSKWVSIAKKISILEKELGFPLVAIAACADDENRKPNNKMWLKLRQFTDGKVVINESGSFYCGDAAGRPDNWKSGHKADFSSDIGFALSSGIRFETPETHFLGEEHYKGADNDISELIPKAETTGKAFEGDSITTKDFEMVINVGYPASGKSTFSRLHFAPAGYEIINQDTLRSKDACLKAAKAALSQGKSVVIDNTNPTVEIRSEYIKLANQFNAKLRCLHFQTPRELAEHLNYYRERTQNIRHYPNIVYNFYNKSFMQPTISEGFSSVIPIKFILNLKPSDLQQYNIPNPKASKKKNC